MNIIFFSLHSIIPTGESAFLKTLNMLSPQWNFAYTLSRNLLHIKKENNYS